MSDNDKKLGVKDILLLNVAAILSIRQIPNVAPYGAASVMLWLLAAIFMFIPLAMVCGELSTGWPEEGGLFVWIREAMGERIGWINVFLYLCSCIVFFPLMLQFLTTTVGYTINASLAENKVYIGVTSIIIMWILTMLNIKGMDWTKKINNFGAIFGVFVPAGVLIILALYWLATGHPMATDYSAAKNWIPNLSKWDNIVFLSSMMFAFAGMEVAPMIAGHAKNPQKDFPRAIFLSALAIVGIYIIGTISMNTLFPAADSNIVAGIMQAMSAASVNLHMPWLLPVMGILIAFGALAQVNSWLVGPIYMLNVASGKNNILGKKISEVDPKTGAPKYALYVQAVLVSIFCLSTFISPSAEAAYWTLTALTTLVYFIPYLFMFASYLVLRKKRPEVNRTFKIPGKVLPIVLPIFGFASTLFAIALLFIPPSQINTGSLFVFELKVAGGGIVAAIAADLLYKKAKKNNEKVQIQ
ncbi:APC family permease [Clostridium sp. JN-1]|uniref:APC family permease n=1 Tax=Clostridium sp. JN-1 TaxID=2483110 RepID=UPI000F0B4444|nr:APC family permease [Clostridium sp. JN-1]